MSPILGWHWTAELRGCPGTHLESPEHLSDAMTRLAAELGLRAVAPAESRLTEHGAVGVLLLAESHVAIHTWPDRGLALVDLFSCVPFDQLEAERIAMALLQANSCSASWVERGTGP